MLVRRRRSAVDRRVGEAKIVARRAKDLQQEISDLQHSIEVLDQVAAVLNTISEERQNAAQDKIENLVTRGLQAIFGGDLSFHIEQTQRAKTTTVDFVVRTTLADGSVVDTPVMDARGGGLAATVGVLLRVVVMLLSGKSSVLFLDEPFAHVSAEYEVPLAEFLRELVDGTDIQIVMVTHSTAYEPFADSVYRFSQSDGSTVVRKVQ